MFEKIIEIVFRNYNSKLRLEWCLLLARALTIFLWLALLFCRVNIHIVWQIMFVIIIFISDALDGIVSRRFSTVKSQYLFRIGDAVVDKIGILLFMIALILLNKSNLYIIGTILTYNILLLIYPIKEIFNVRDRQIDKIQATLLSRLYAICVGLYIFFALNFSLTQDNQMFSFILFIVLSALSLCSHIFKIQSLKR